MTKPVSSMHFFTTLHSSKAGQAKLPAARECSDCKCQVSQTLERMEDFIFFFFYFHPNRPFPEEHRSMLINGRRVTKNYRSCNSIIMMTQQLTREHGRRLTGRHRNASFREMMIHVVAVHVKTKWPVFQRFVMSF